MGDGRDWRNFSIRPSGLSLVDTVEGLEMNMYCSYFGH